MKASTLFKLDDKYIQSRGLYALWMAIWITTVSVLGYDDTVDDSRHFSIFAMGIACIYPFVMTFNNIYGNGVTSTFMMIGTSFHQFLFWMLFTYFKPNNVLGSHPIGVMNWVWVFITVPFTCDMLFKTWWLVFNKNEYKEYTNSYSQSQRVVQHDDS